MNKPKVAVIGTGGTIASIGKNPLDIVDYGANKTMIGIEEILAMFPIVHDVAEIVAVPYQAIPSPSVGFTEWRDLVLKIDELAQDLSLDGIVVTHGTASLEETRPAPDREGGPAGGGGWRATPIKRPVDRRRLQYRQRRPHGRITGGQGHGRDDFVER